MIWMMQPAALASTKQSILFERKLRLATRSSLVRKLLRRKCIPKEDDICWGDGLKNCLSDERIDCARADRRSHGSKPH